MQTIQIPTLAPGERLAGLILDAAGAPEYWVVLLHARAVRRLPIQSFTHSEAA